jgi:hypothetical protein
MRQRRPGAELHQLLQASSGKPRSGRASILANVLVATGRSSQLGDGAPFTTKIREADLQQLAQIASTYPNRQRFLTELTLDPPSAPAKKPAYRSSTRTT